MQVSRVIAAAAVAISTHIFAAEPCRVIHGRANLYLGDGQFRLWHIGTHHEYDLGEGEESWNVLEKYMIDSSGVATNVVFGDFLVCPTAPFMKGAAQPAIVKKLMNPVVLTYEQFAALQKSRSTAATPPAPHPASPAGHT